MTEFEATESDTDRASDKRRRPHARGGGSKGGFFRELPILVVVALVVAVLLRAFIVESFYIPSGSMEKTLHGCPGCTADRLLVNRMVYRFHPPRPGDIVVFSAPDGWHISGDDAVAGDSVPARMFDQLSRWVGGGGSGRPKLVKRVIAVGGQTVRCCDYRGRVVVDGRPLHEPYVYTDGPDPRRRFRPVTVPHGYLWVMGDHRNVSADSRWHARTPERGMVPVGDVVGEPFAVYWPVSRWRTLNF